MRPGGRLPPRPVAFGLFAVAAVAGFMGPLVALVCLAWDSRLHSHALLVPAISAWFVFRHRAPLPSFRTSPAAAAVLLAAAGALVAAAALSWVTGPDVLSLHVLAMLLTLGGGWMVFLGWPSFRARLFPLLFLLFVVPLPGPVVHLLNVVLQDGTAWLSHWVFAAIGWPIHRSGYLLALPGLTLEVAEECSGINSTYALFITSVLAGWMLLKSPWKRALFVAVVLPLGVMRNTFRIVTLAVLTLKVDPRVLDSPLHHRGGPIFFALALVPLLGLLVALRWTERRRPADAEPNTNPEEQ